MWLYELTLVILLQVKTENKHDDENEIYNQYSYVLQTLNTICPQYKSISKSVLII
jgi:hypothetical protein